MTCSVTGRTAHGGGTITPSSESSATGADAVIAKPGRGDLRVAFRLDPFDPSSWSGTPRHLGAALERAGWRIAGEALGLPRGVGRAIDRSHALLRLGPDTNRNPLARRLRGRALRVVTSEATLHFGTMHLPMPRSVAGSGTHVMYLDTTWDLWSRHRTGIAHTPAWLERQAQRDERRAYAQMDHIFTTSKAARQNLISVYGRSPDSVTAIGTGLGQRLPDRVRTTAAAPQLLYVGKHRPVDKGLDLVLDALPSIQARCPGTALTVVGRIPSSFSVPDGVLVRGWVEENELADHYASADLFVLPARNEPWGLVYLEALSQGTPVLGVDRHAFAEIAANGEYGVIVKEPEVEAVVDAVVSALDDRGALATKGAAGCSHVLATCDWDKVAAPICNFLDRSLHE